MRKKIFKMLASPLPTMIVFVGFFMMGCASTPKINVADLARSIESCKSASYFHEIVGRCYLSAFYRDADLDQTDPGVVYSRNKYNNALDSGNADERLIKAVVRRDTDRVKKALAEGGDPNAEVPLRGLFHKRDVPLDSDLVGRPVWVAGKLEILNILVDAGAKLDEAHKNMCSKSVCKVGLFHHYIDSNPEAIDYLLNNGYKVTLSDYNGSLQAAGASGSQEAKYFAEIVKRNASREVLEEYAAQEARYAAVRAKSEELEIERKRANELQFQKIAEERASQDAERIRVLKGRLGTKVCKRNYMKIVTYEPYLRWGEVVKRETPLIQAEIQARINRQSDDGVNSELQLIGVGSYDPRMPSVINEVIIAEERLVTNTGMLFWDSTKFWVPC